MKSIMTKWLPLLLLAVFIGGFGYLSFVDISVPQSPVEKVIPNNQFFQ